VAHRASIMEQLSTARLGIAAVRERIHALRRLRWSNPPRIVGAGPRCACRSTPSEDGRHQRAGEGHDASPLHSIPQPGSSYAQPTRSR
jgi:hypothetical protein